MLMVNQLTVTIHQVNGVILHACYALCIRLSTACTGWYHSANHNDTALKRHQRTQPDTSAWWNSMPTYQARKVQHEKSEHDSPLVLYVPFCLGFGCALKVKITVVLCAVVWILLECSSFCLPQLDPNIRADCVSQWKQSHLGSKWGTI